MSFMFLHPEFFLWMLPPLLFLFYFWQTQQPLESRWLSETVLKRLRSDAMSMGLKGRNILFFIAGILLLAAMAQPVLVDENPLTRSKADVIVAIEAGTDSPESFERAKVLALKTLNTLRGENIALIAYDQNVYRIAPFTQQSDLVTSLVWGLNFKDFRLPSERAGMITRLKSSGIFEKADGMMILSAAGRTDTLWEGAFRIDVITAEGDIIPAVQRIREQVQEHQRRFHIPLFYFPLGMAMILILIALSSMSRRQSVPLAGILLTLVVNAPSSHAGILDFQLLNGAKNAYEKGQYHQSAALFAAYQEHHDSPQVRYNRANALYKAGRFREADYWYRQVHTTDPILSEWTRLNRELCLSSIRQKSDAEKPDTSEYKEKKHPSVEKKGGERTALQSGKIHLFRFE